MNLFQVGQQNLMKLKRRWKCISPSRVGVGWVPRQGKVQYIKAALTVHLQARCKEMVLRGAPLPNVTRKDHQEKAIRGCAFAGKHSPNTSFSSVLFLRMPGLSYELQKLQPRQVGISCPLPYPQLFRTLVQPQVPVTQEGPKTKEALCNQSIPG